MILLWGSLDDEPMAMARAALARANADVFFLDQDILDRSRLDLSGVAVAYVRISNPREDDARRAAHFNAELAARLDASDAVVINRSAPSAANNSKPYQLAIVRQAGFRVPDTLLTNDPAAARAFLAERKEIIYKSISGTRSIVRPVGERQLASIDDVRWCPTCFQEQIHGTNHRVHVIGDRVLALRIESDGLDYRYCRTTMRETRLPVVVADRCRQLTAMLGLHFSGIDLMLTPQGDWYCFEVNPSPAFSYFEALSGQPIAASFAEFMIAEDYARRSSISRNPWRSMDSATARNSAPSTACASPQLRRSLLYTRRVAGPGSKTAPPN
jgi:hypothetical protein